MRYKLQKFKNGPEVIFVKSPNLSFLNISAFIKSGSIYESKNNNGISHFTEHMLFKGTKTYPSHESLFNVLDCKGIEWSAITRTQYTYISFNLKHKEIEAGLNLLSEILLNPKFDKEGIKNEKKVIIEEIKNSNLDFIEKFINKTNKLLFKRTALSFDVLGTINNIKKFNRQAIIQYWKKHYSANNIILCLAGNIDIDRAGLLIKNNFKAQGSESIKIPVINPKCEKFIKYFFHNPNLKDRAMLSWSFKTPAVSSKKYHLVSLLNIFLNRKLGNLFRENLALSYDIESDQTQFSSFGILDINLTFSRKDMGKIIERLFNEINKIEISRHELDRAKKIANTQLKFIQNDPSSLSYYFGEQRILNPESKLMNTNEETKTINKISLRDFNQFTKTILNKNKSVCFVESGHASDKPNCCRRLETLENA